jgi:formate hydrogenlyase transcriptional activator
MESSKASEKSAVSNDSHPLALESAGLADTFAGFTDFCSSVSEVNVMGDLEEVIANYERLFFADALLFTVYNTAKAQHHVWFTSPDMTVEENLSGHFFPVKQPAVEPSILNFKELETKRYLPYLPVKSTGLTYVSIVYLYHGEEPVGAVYFFYKEVPALSYQQLQLTKIVCHQLTMAIRQIHLSQAIEKHKQDKAEREKERTLSLAVSNELSAVRTKSDLLRVLNSSLSKILHFTHAVISVSNLLQQTYYGFIRDHKAPSTIHPDYNHNVASTYSLQDTVMTQVMRSSEPLIFDLEKLGEHPSAPGWLRMSYESGSREVVVIGLQVAEQHFGAFFVHSNEQHNFQPEQLQFIKAISYQLANVVANILANKEITQQEYEKSILLSISKRIAAVRSKEDLLEMINGHLKKLLPISHTLTSRLAKNGKVYYAYMLDPQSPCRAHREYSDLVKTVPVTEGLINLILLAEQPLLFDLEDIINHPETPGFLRINYDCGIRQMVCSPFGTSNRKSGFLTIFIDPGTSIKINEMGLIQGAAAQLSTAIANIIANEEITEGEKEKSSLLAFSNELAGVRDRPGLTRVVSHGLNNLFQLTESLLTIKNQDETIDTFFLFDRDTALSNDHRFEQIKDKKIPIENALANAVFNSPDSISFEINELLKPGRLKMESAGFWRSVGVNSILGTPLRAGDEVIGALWTFNHQHPNERLLSGVASLIAVALANTMANEKINNQLTQISNYKQQLEVENRYLQEEIQTTHNYSELIGSSPAMKKVFEMVSQVSATESSVLILGETGTGKELIARALHNASLRKTKLMVKVNCATLPPNLIESELFGHERGAFTGAVERRIGKFELANNSTLFLDEIGELPLDLQVKLLRALQEREIERVGGRSVIKVNVRIIAATNRNLHKEVQQGNFRSDLFFRLNVFPIELPVLRERLEDIPILAAHFMLKYTKKSMKGKMAFSNKAIKQLMAYNWPGNVRELEHLIERTILVTDGNMIHHIHLPSTETDELNQIFPDSRVKTIDDVEREHIIYVLKKCNGRVAGIGGAAAMLRIPSTTLNSKIKRLNIKKGLNGPTA